jgi:hypothetical protein
MPNARETFGNPSSAIEKNYPGFAPLMQLELGLRGGPGFALAI